MNEGENGTHGVEVEITDLLTSVEALQRELLDLDIKLQKIDLENALNSGNPAKIETTRATLLNLQQKTAGLVDTKRQLLCMYNKEKDIKHAEEIMRGVREGQILLTPEVLDVVSATLAKIKTSDE